ncbi:MAG TPA: CHAT domain-containing protein [Armatimonadota bacterium]
MSEAIKKDRNPESGIRNPIPCAVLTIHTAAGGLVFEWTGPDGAPLRGRRSVHPDDLAGAAGMGEGASRSLLDLERSGARLFSRVMERSVREAVFAAEPALLRIDGDFPHIPWELAFDGSRFLGETHAVGMGPAAETPLPRDALRVLFVYDPTSDLPHSHAEIAAIRRQLAGAARVEAEELCAAAATRDRILSAIESRGFDVLHFSCHVDSPANSPALSAIRAFDGPLTAEDILQAAAARPPVLAVLNACESARGGGLAEAFRQAGAAAAVGALWPVSNKPAAHMMAAFHAGLAAGLPAGEALRGARSETRRAFAHDACLSWAAFRLIGPPQLRLLEPGPSAGRAPLMGREPQWQALEDAWAAARSGRPQAVVLVGGPGSGKTRLMSDWLAAHPSASVRDLVDDPPRGPAILTRDGFRPDDVPLAAARLSSGGPVLLLLTAREAAVVAGLGPGVRALALDPLWGEALEGVFRSLGAPVPPGLQRAAPAEAERLALGGAAGELAGELAGGLPEDQRAILRAGAVLGAAFSARDAAAVRADGVGEPWRALESLCAANWLAETEPGVFTFSSEAARTAVLNAFRPKGERLEWERRAATLRSEQGRPGEAGEHFIAAGDASSSAAAFAQAFREAEEPSDIVRWVNALAGLGSEPDDPARAAQAFADTGDWASARRWWERAVEGGGERGDSLVRLAGACRKSGDVPAAERYLIRAQGLARAAEVDLGWAEILLRKCLPVEAMARARAARDQARADGDAALAGRAALAAADAALLAAAPVEAAAMCEAGLRENPAPACRAALSRTLAQARQYAGDYGAAEITLAGLLAEQPAGTAPHERASTLLALAELQRDQGRLTEALAAVDEAEGLGARCGQPGVVADALNLRSSVQRRQGLYGDALESAALAGETARNAHLAPAAIRATIHTATLLAERGELDAARIAAETANRNAEDAGYAFGQTWARNMLGVALLEAGDTVGARAAFTEALDAARAIGGHIGIAAAWNHLGWTDWEEGTPNPAAFREAEAVAARISYRAVQLPAAFGAALCAGDDAASDAALAGLESLNMGALAAWLRLRRGEERLRNGRPDDAERDLAAAWRVSRRLGLRILHARADAALGAL